MKLTKLDDPLNAEERFLHAIAVRQDVLIEQMNSIIEYIAKRDKVAVTESKVETTVQPEPAPVPVVKPVARKRAPRKPSVKE